MNQLKKINKYQPIIFLICIVFVCYQFGTNLTLTNNFQLLILLREGLVPDWNDLFCNDENGPITQTQNQEQTYISVNKLSFASGLYSLSLGNCTSVKAVFEDISKLENYNGRVEFWYALTLLQSGETNNAVALFRHLDAESFLFMSGVEARNRNETENAIAWFNLAFQVEPRYENVEALANSYKRADHMELAANTWQEWASTLPESSAYHWRALGEVVAIEKNWEAAADYYAIGANLPDADLLLIKEGLIAAKQAGDWQLAEVFVKQAIEIEPNNISTYIDAANLYLTLDQLDLATDYVSLIAQIKPDDWHVAYLQGRIDCQQDLFDIGINNLQTALSASDEDNNVFFALVECIFNEGDMQAALQLLNDRISYARKNDSIIHERQLGSLLLKLGNQCLAEDDLACAKDYFSQASQIDSVEDQALNKLQSMTKDE